MKPDGIHFAPGTIKGLPFRIFLDLSGPVINDQFDKILQSAAAIEKRIIIEIPAKKLPGRINYKIHNYCARCKIKYGKDVYRCKNCKSRVRTKPWASNYSRKKRDG